MGTIQPLTRDELAQIRQWYADPVRALPRKVVRDVAALLDHIACQAATRRAALEEALRIAGACSIDATVAEVYNRIRALLDDAGSLVKPGDTVYLSDGTKGVALPDPKGGNDVR